MKHHLCIIYDGIANSVFESQLLIPFAQKVAQFPDDRGLLISFERSMPEQKYLQLMAKYPQITLVILNKIPFLGSISLRYAAYQLERTIRSYTIASVLARGPLAGWIAGHCRSFATITTIVQARGLAGQEYAYAHIHDIPRYDYSVITRDERLRKSIPLVVSGFLSTTKKIVSNHIPHAFRTRQYESIERWAYGHYGKKNNVSIHAVSDALKNYLIEHFNAPSAKITVATYDIPTIIAPEKKTVWRQQIRKELSIPESSYVYVYSGSAKAWQCPQETVAYAAQQYKKDARTFLLILSQDAAIFHALCTQYGLPADSYHITSVAHTAIYHYLAAADAGMVLRESHPINWVSRPTKILEYQAAGLAIVHNDTVGILAAAQRMP